MVFMALEDTGAQLMAEMGSQRSGHVTALAPLRRRRMDAEHVAERRLGEERDHNLWSSLLALDAGLRALAPAVSGDAGKLLLDALGLELQAARRLVAGDTEVEPGAFDLAATVRAWCVLESATGAEVEVELPGTLTVTGESSLTVEVLRSVFDNARRHAAASPIHLSVELDGEWVELHIADRGPGVPDPERIFERGYSGAGSQGLGLYLATRSMRRQGGWLRVASSEQGSTFALRFRCAR
jgi:signal transduction histidine kinase